MYQFPALLNEVEMGHARCFSFNSSTGMPIRSLRANPQIIETQRLINVTRENIPLRPLEFSGAGFPLIDNSGFSSRVQNQLDSQQFEGVMNRR
jgi:hypothetical protein